ncbi:hypothetical protein UG55_11011 [Frankia sp. EI5c]|uniref:hypothetical protein n=1 Tax=Frankia sp. EI5c TaxID=683316 RepID=UPI0007C35690|nr:hypothetical protein [Frankia sp. EI5c]OAA18698.1 hypothetical protein UG55_11011 [Frankia sp. EI5c]
MRAVIGTGVFVIVAAVGLAVVGAAGGAGWSFALVLLAAAGAGVLSAGRAVRHRPERGERVCPECHGEGYAFYGRGRTTSRRRCRTCRGRGMDPAPVRIPEALLRPGTRTEGESVPVQ